MYLNKDWSIERISRLALTALMVFGPVFGPAGLALASDASDPFAALSAAGASIQSGGNSLIGYIVWIGCFGILGLSIWSKGKFPFGWAAAIVGGIFAVYYGPYFVNYLKPKS